MERFGRDLRPGVNLTCVGKKEEEEEEFNSNLHKTTLTVNFHLGQ